MLHAAFESLFARDLPHGRCVGVALPEGDALQADVPAATLGELLEVERRHVETLAPARRAGWVGGRIALRAALADLQIDAGPILATPRGAPELPAGARGSISHKKGLVVALAARAGGGIADEEGAGDGAAPWHLGIDLERVVPGHSGIARYVLRADERARLPPGDDPRRVEELLFAFSAKEAIYKAIDPFLGRYVSFQEVAVERRDDGEATASFHLKTREAFGVDVRWLRYEDFIVTTARVSLGR
jgi:4'-phosphopantetheinyl transferase EntD